MSSHGVPRTFRLRLTDRSLVITLLHASQDVT